MTSLKTVASWGAIATLAAISTPLATAQPIPPQARDACMMRTAEEMTVATRDLMITGAGPVDPENGVRTLFMRNSRTGQTAECRVNTIDGYVLSVKLTSSGSGRPPGGSGSSSPIPTQALNACIMRTAEEMLAPTSEVMVVGAGPVDPENGVRTLFMRNSRTAQTAECRVNTIDGYVLSVRLTSSGSARPPSPAPVPTEGDFRGKGTASGSVFGRAQQVDAALTFNQSNNFSLSLAVPPGNGNQVSYQGVITRRMSTGINSFKLETSVQRFASSANNLRVVETRGNCRIEVFDARITAATCRVNVPNGNTQFSGMAQF